MTLRSRIVLGTGVCAALTVGACLLMGPQAMASGILAGLCIATVGLLLFARAYPADTSIPFSRMVTNHIVGALLIRIPILCGIFVASILLIRINSIGILIGITAGAIVFGVAAFARFISINNRQGVVS